MLEVTRLTKKFFPGTINEIVALKGLDLRLEEGDFLTVIGSNGAGKTTLLNTIAGTLIPTSGRVFIAGEDVTELPEHSRAQMIGRVFQEPGQGTAAGMTVAQNLVLASRKGGRGLRLGVTEERKERFRDELAKLGLGLEGRLGERVTHLSGGQRQGLAVLMATMIMPSLLLLDEHTASLDPKNARKIMDITERLVKAKGLTTIMVTHDMGQAIELGDRLAMLHRGDIVFQAREEEKEELTVEDLVASFSRGAGEGLADDELLLTMEGG